MLRGEIARRALRRGQALSRDACRSRTISACVLSSSYNNPLGCTMPEPRKREVLALLAKHRVPLVEDNIYGDVGFGTERPRPFIAFDPHDNTLYCSSFSKTIAPGYRIGCGRRRRASCRG